MKEKKTLDIGVSELRECVPLKNSLAEHRAYGATARTNGQSTIAVVLFHTHSHSHTHTFHVRRTSHIRAFRARRVAKRLLAVIALKSSTVKRTYIEMKKRNAYMCMCWLQWRHWLGTNRLECAAAIFRNWIYFSISFEIYIPIGPLD